MQVVIENARRRDVELVKRLADAHRAELGFIMRPVFEASQRDRELLVARVDRVVVGFVRWHARLDGWNTVYELCVDPQHRDKGLGTRLLRRIPRPTRLKCPTGNPANRFYGKLRFRRTGREPGRRRTLNIWVRRRQDAAAPETAPQRESRHRADAVRKEHGGHAAHPARAHRPQDVPGRQAEDR